MAKRYTAKFKFQAVMEVLTGQQSVAQAAKDKPIHFHLAWEMTNNPEKTLEKLIELGIKSVRTAGGQGLGGRVKDGIEKVRLFKTIASDSIDLLLAGGVKKDNISNLVFNTGVINAHVGTSVRNPPNPSGKVLTEKVRALKQTLEAGIKKLEKSLNAKIIY